MTVLATACDSPELQAAGRNEPMLMTIQYHKGRVFHNALGHDDYSFESVGADSLAPLPLSTFVPYASTSGAVVFGRQESVVRVRECRGESRFRRGESHADNLMPADAQGVSAQCVG